MSVKLNNPYEGDQYARLGVSKKAGRKQIERAFRRCLKNVNNARRLAADRKREDEEKMWADAGQQIQFAKDNLHKAEKRAKIDLVTFWEERKYTEILERYVDQTLTLEVKEDWDVRTAFTEVTERDALAALQTGPPLKAPWLSLPKYDVPPLRAAKIALVR